MRSLVCFLFSCPAAAAADVGSPVPCPAGLCQPAPTDLWQLPDGRLVAVPRGQTPFGVVSQPAAFAPQFAPQAFGVSGGCAGGSCGDPQYAPARRGIFRR